MGIEYMCTDGNVIKYIVFINEDGASISTVTADMMAMEH